MSEFITFSSQNKVKKTTEKIYEDLAIKASEYLKDKSGKALHSVRIKGDGLGYYWSPSDKKLILVPKSAEYYYLPWEKDEKGRIFLFLPSFLTSGLVICVDPDDIEVLGFN